MENVNWGNDAEGVLFTPLCNFWYEAAYTDGLELTHSDKKGENERTDFLYVWYKNY